MSIGIRLKFSRERKANHRNKDKNLGRLKSSSSFLVWVYILRYMDVCCFVYVRLFSFFF